jgi:uncharacterized protein Yka (UPF0111/DUF47 family)
MPNENSARPRHNLLRKGNLDMSDKSDSLVTRLFKRVFPRMPDFYGLLNDQCNVLVEAMQAFVTYMENGSEADAETVRALEKRGDELKVRNTDILNRAFSTPMDREDIYRAITALDLGLNYAKTTTREMEVLELSPDAFMLEMAVEYLRAAEALQEGFRKLSSAPADADNCAGAARKTERNVEKIYRRALAKLFEVDATITRLEAGEQGSRAEAMLTVVDIFKRREIYRHLSNGSDRLARAADRLHDIIVKLT